MVASGFKIQSATKLARSFALIQVVGGQLEGGSNNPAFSGQVGLSVRAKTNYHRDCPSFDIKLLSDLKKIKGLVDHFEKILNMNDRRSIEEFKILLRQLEQHFYVNNRRLAQQQTDKHNNKRLAQQQTIGITMEGTRQNLCGDLMRELRDYGKHFYHGSVYPRNNFEALKTQVSKQLEAQSRENQIYINQNQQTQDFDRDHYEKRLKSLVVEFQQVCLQNHSAQVKKAQMIEKLMDQQRDLVRKISDSEFGSGSALHGKYGDFINDMKMKLEEDEESEENECNICMDQERTHQFVPCGHDCACEKCASKICTTDDPTCPICRHPVTGQFKLDR